MEVQLAGPDLAVVGEILEIPGLPAGPFDLAGELSRSGGTVIVREAKLSAGGAELTIDAEFAKLPDPDGGTVLVNLRGSDLGRFDRLLGPLPGLSHKPFEATVALTQRERERSTSKRPLASARTASRWMGSWAPTRSLWAAASTSTSGGPTSPSLAIFWASTRG